MEFGKKIQLKKSVILLLFCRVVGKNADFFWFVFHILKKSSFFFNKKLIKWKEFAIWIPLCRQQLSIKNIYMENIKEWKRIKELYEIVCHWDVVYVYSKERNNKYHSK